MKRGTAYGGFCKIRRQRGRYGGAAGRQLGPQQQAVQKKTIEDRLSNKNKPLVNEQGARISDPAITGSASGAMERMKVLLANMPKGKR